MKEEKKKEISKKIGKRIYNIRKKHKLSREKFAEICNVSSQHVYYMEKGEFLPGCMTIIDICNNFDITPTELLIDSMNLNNSILEEEIKNNFEALKNEDKKLVVDITTYVINKLAKRNLEN